MNVLCIQHAAFETPAYLETVIKRHGHKLQILQMFKEHPFPESSSFDVLVIMGGPMGVYDDKYYPWLTREKKFISQCVNNNKKVLGICLGAQLLAHALGAEVRKNKVREIGFFPITLNGGCLTSPLLQGIPENVIPLHWHGDTFGIPSAGIAIASSVACSNQGFVVGDKQIGLQFHLEMTIASLNGIIEHCGGELVESEWVQSEKIIRSTFPKYEKANQLLMERLYVNLCEC